MTIIGGFLLWKNEIDAKNVMGRSCMVALATYVTNSCVIQKALTIMQ